MANTHKEYMQLSAAEVPGFHVRTQCDDAIRQLWALRSHLRDPIPDEVDDLLDSIHGALERAIEVGLDGEAPEIGTEGVERDGLPPLIARYSGGRLAESGSPLSACSCGGIWP